MAIERKLGLVSPVLFTSNGTAGGLVTVPDTKGFVVKAQVVLTANTLPTLQLEIKRVLSSTQFLVGEKGKIEQRANILAYTTALNSSIYQPEQDRPGIMQEQHERAVYAEEPIMAKRNILVDEYGRYYNSQNPIPVNATLNVENVTVDVKLEAMTGSQPDNVLLVGTENGQKTGAKYAFINNVKNQILASHDRKQKFFYEDFGNKNQRITQIDYTSDTFLGVTASKVITYVLVGNRYKRENIDWVINTI
jgi:hypothetical protein